MAYAFVKNESISEMAKHMTPGFLRISLTSCVALFSLSAVATNALDQEGAAAAGAAPLTELPDGEGQMLVQENCTMCHDLTPILSERHTAEGWAAIIEEMKSYGAFFEPEHEPVMAAYMGSVLGVAPSEAAPLTALPEGEGMMLVQENCTLCHDLTPILSQRRTTEGWAAIVEEMKSYGAFYEAADEPIMVAYLSTAIGLGGSAATADSAQGQHAEGVEADDVTVPVADTYDPDAADEFETEGEASVD